MEILACFGVDYIYHHKISSSNYSKKIRINSELLPLDEKKTYLMCDIYRKIEKNKKMQILELKLIEKDLIDEYPDISMVDIRKLANNITSIKYEDSKDEIHQNIDIKKLNNKIKILHDELDKIEEIELLEEIKHYNNL